MGYSDPALRLRKPIPSALPRLEDRVSFLYLDCCKIAQSATGVTGYYDDQSPGPAEIDIPAGSIAALILGPGTSVTAPAVATLARAGCAIVYTGEEGMVAYGQATPLTASGEWAQAQARVWANPQTRLAAALWLYRKRFPHSELPPDLTLATLRGLEGRHVRLAYQEHATRHHLRNFRRVTVGATDNVNIALNMANSLLYGCAAAVCSALALNPALGIIHHGDASAFLFDIADLYKLQTAVPAAFAAAQTEDPKTHVRRAMRRHFRDQQMLSAMMTTITELFGPHRQAATSDQLLDDAGYVPGGHNYGQPCS